MKKIDPEIWQPADNIVLEPNALRIAKRSENNLVVAGPGAGKTELLAQKACFLLQTNSCPYPYKILAISFKRDAAFNLKERVRLRSGEELAWRFESLTFDSFAKQIFDRFKQALPMDYKLTDNYNIELGDQTILDYYQLENIDYFNTTNRDLILKLHHCQLPHSANNSGEKIRNIVWKKMLGTSSSTVSFKMLMRLAEFVINNNPTIKQYLQQTYRYVFMDEFQDTTEVQYDLFKSCFLNSECLFTAVGDDKQRIMLWAGARNTVFDDFIKDTEAIRLPLTMNFRSAPRLVLLLNHLTKHLLRKSDFAVPSPKWQHDQGECSVWIFDNPNNEMQVVFQEIQNLVIVKKLNPRDICIIVKQQLSTYAGKLIEYFNQNGISARDENKFQDMLTHEIALFVINLLYIIFDNKNTAARHAAFDFLSSTRSEIDNSQLLKLDEELSSFIKKHRQNSTLPLTATAIKLMINEIVDLVDRNRIKAIFPYFKNSAILDSLIKDLGNELENNYNVSNDLISALNMLIGKDTVPVMTIHKSKGLEYNTIIFIGLEDGAFWSFQRQPDEDKCAFFVALSRAKERVIFTFSKQREGRFGLQKQSATNIKILFDELEKSGIVDFKEIK